MDKEKIFIIIPAYNEADKIQATIQDVQQYYSQIIVVNDCSVDRTAKLAKKAGAIVLNHLLNRGQGASLDTGTKYALSQGAEIIVHFDADGQFLAKEIIKLVQPILDDASDIVLGSRFLDIKSNLPKFKKYFIMPLARLFIKLIYRARLTDPQNGFRAFNRRVGLALNIDNDGAAHCTEIIVKMLSGSWRYQEVSVTVVYNHFGASLLAGKGRGAGGINILKSLFLQKIIK